MGPKRFAEGWTGLNAAAWFLFGWHLLARREFKVIMSRTKAKWTSSRDFLQMALTKLAYIVNSCAFKTKPTFLGFILC